MKWIKKFETFDFSQTLPLASKSDLTLFYHCDDCDSLWKVLNEEAIICKFCKIWRKWMHKRRLLIQYYILIRYKESMIFEQRLYFKPFISS